jgi:hypothetical protein
MLLFSIHSSDDPKDDRAMGDFISFVSEELIPGIDTSATRLGAVEAVEFYNSGVRGHLNEYVLLVEGLMAAHGALRGAIAKLEQRGAKVEQIGDNFGGHRWVVGADGKLEQDVPPTLTTETVRGFVNRGGNFVPTGDGAFCADRLVGEFFNIRLREDETDPAPADQLAP